MGIISFIFKLLVALAIFCLGFGIWRSWSMEHAPEQQRFLAGTFPDPVLQGEYQGRVPGHIFAWQGKKFDSRNAAGINKFNAADGTSYEKYAFVTATGPGVRMHNGVVRIDYNIPENPWWLRPVLDEVVQVGDGQYLGKMHYRILPGFPFTVTFFELSR